ncbi:MAG: hypothetical protein LBQ48_04870, partial [Oscillospiraceae bacterium]|nr:hypothetical protein [Oscillospiraceae bacterium]
MKTQIVKLLLTAILPLTLISCRVVNGDVTALMRPPRPPGEYYEIQKALEKYVKATVYLKYPKSGDNRSAFIVRDLDGDGVKNEAIAFYSLVADGSTLHMNIIGKDVSDWNSLADIDLKASDIERADFADMTGQGCENIVVGLKMFTSLARQIRVLSFQGRKLTESLAENYTEYALADLDGDSLKELLLVSLNTAEPATSIARMVKLNGT